MRIGVIGGGVAGLTAAYELSKLGHTVAVFEKDAVLGGQASTFDLDGVPLERFYHHIFTSDVDIIQLIEEVGLGPRLQWPGSKVGFYHGGRIYDFVTALELLRFKPVSLIGRVRLGLISMYLKWYSNWQALEGITARQWLIKYGGRRTYDVVWGPLLKNKFGASADEIGMVWLWGKIHLRMSSRHGGREHLGYLDGSYGVLFDRLKELIIEAGGEVHTSAPVERVVVEDGKAVGLQVGQAVHPCDLVLATVPSPVFLELVPPLPPDYRQKLEGIRYQGAVVLALVLKHQLSHIYWMNISDPQLPFVALVEHTNLVPPSVYGGRHILYVSNYLAHDHPLYSMEADELMAQYLPHLEKVNPDFEPGWVEGRYLFRDDAGQPIVGTGYSSRIPEHATPIANLYLANTTQIYPEDRGMNYSVRLGRKAARLVSEEA